MYEITKRGYNRVDKLGMEETFMPLSDHAAEHKKQVSIEYAKSHYKRIPLDVTYDYYDRIKAAAAAAGDTVNGFIKKAIDVSLSK